MLGVVVAAEDIDPGAGRFYICSRSHASPIADEGDGLDLNGPEYKQLMKDFVVNGPHECIAPVLRQGDMVIFSSRTVHGSLETTNKTLSRSTFNGHWIPASQSLWRIGSVGEHQHSLRVNGVRITSHGSQHSPVAFLKRRVNSRIKILIKGRVKAMFPRIAELLDL